MLMPTIVFAMISCSVIGAPWKRTEGREQLADEAARKIERVQAELSDLAVARPKIGPEQQVPDNEAVRVVGIRFHDLPRVVPAMDLGAANEIVEPAKSHVAVGMLEQSAHRVEHKVVCQHFRPDADEHKGERVEQKLQCLLGRVEAEYVGRVELLGLMMNGMQSPERRPGVSGAVQPVSEEIPGDDLEQKLGPDRPGVGPRIEDNDRMAELLVSNQTTAHARANGKAICTMV